MEINIIFERLSSLRDFCCGTPASSEQIDDAESKLGVKFPWEYRALLAKFGYVAWEGCRVAGIANDKTYGIVLGTEYVRSIRLCPSNAVVLNADYVMFCDPSPNEGLVTNAFSVSSSPEIFEYENFLSWLESRV
jgi:hypothetical protein